MKYSKEYSSPSELISILQNRGLDCSDIDNAIDILSSIGYYRSSGYFYPFLLTPKSEHIFKPGSTLGNAESDEQGRNVPKSASVADCPVVVLKCL